MTLLNEQSAHYSTKVIITIVVHILTLYIHIYIDMIIHIFVTMSLKFALNLSFDGLDISTHTSSSCCCCDSVDNGVAD